MGEVYFPFPPLCASGPALSQASAENRATEIVYSDGLMMMLARAGDPKYRSSELQVKATVDLKFKGELAELLDVYRQLTKTEE